MNNNSNYNYQQNEGYDYSANRCRICNRELQDPRQLYGEWCARKNGLDPYGGPADADKKEKIEFIVANNYDNNELKIPTIDNLTIEEYNECIEDEPAFAEYMLYHTNNYNKKVVNEFVRFTVASHGGMKQGDPNVYQVIYTAPITDNPAINNTRDMNTQYKDPMHSDVNMYDNYQFTIFDAMTWLIQTGGRGNFVLQTRATENWYEAARVQNEIVRSFVYAHSLMQDAGVIDRNTKPKLYIGSTEKNGSSAEWIYKSIANQEWIKDKDIIAGIYYGCEDVINYDNEEELELKWSVADYVHKEDKEIIWMPYFSDDKQLAEIENYIVEARNGRALFDKIIIQPGAFYGKSSENIEKIMGVVKSYSGEGSSKRVGLEMEFDMGLVTGRKDNNMDVFNKRTILQEYLDNLYKLKGMDVPIGVYSGGPNEQGYRDIWNNINTHNSGNHIPYWEGIDESAYATRVHYNHFPNAYQGGNLIYDINNYIYNGIMNDNLKKWLDWAPLF
ncbi:MAG: DUF4855 domain-containing protein [Clostridia bacterium]|nr:DUF4855 domain-containing protein [Clostridia bacterium]